MEFALLPGLVNIFPSIYILNFWLVVIENIDIKQYGAHHKHIQLSK